MESSLTRGSERTRSRSETVTTTAFRSGSRDPPDGAGDKAGSVAVDTSGDAEYVGFGT
jgi:hypothetical protein